MRNLSSYAICHMSKHGFAVRILEFKTTSLEHNPTVEEGLLFYLLIVSQICLSQVAAPQNFLPSVSPCFSICVNKGLWKAWIVEKFTVYNAALKFLNLFLSPTWVENKIKACFIFFLIWCEAFSNLYLHFVAPRRDGKGVRPWHCLVWCAPSVTG